jgi:hypothetical protein
MDDLEGLDFNLTFDNLQKPATQSPAEQTETKSGWGFFNDTETT